MVRHARALLLAVGAIASLGTAACGSSSSSSSSSNTSAASTTSSPATTTATGSKDVSKQVPSRVISTGKQKLSAKAFAGLAPGPRAAGPKPAIAGLGGLPVSAQALSVADDVAGYWTTVANKSNLKLAPATVTIVDQTPFTCGSASISTNDTPGYCPANTTAYLPLARITKSWESIGNAAVAELVGELYGYHIAFELGLYNKLSNNDLTKTGICFSGAWMYTVYKRGLIQTGDIDALGKLLTDYGGSGKAGSLTAADFIKAFNTGYLSGAPGKCIPKSAGGAG